jgi:TRAP-type mannitol/chloroaromatic compound transport system permease small subunit
MALIDRFTALIGKSVSWLSLILVLVMVVDVVLRYWLSITSAASFELEWHLFAMIFLLGSAYALREDRHVRVDVFYQRFSRRTRAIINLLGTLFLLLPFCAITFWESLSFVQHAYEMGETSPDPGGLPARFLIKSAIPAGFLLLGLQGVSEALKCIKVLLL